MLWESCSSLERRALKAIARCTVALASRDAATRFGLPKSRSTQIAVERLVRDGHLVADDTARSGWRIADPILAAWLRDEP